MTLADKIRQMPQNAGIYQYFDNRYKILYIGKAKNLKKRVKSYFSLKDGIVYPAQNLSPRISNMVQKIYDIKTIIVDNEQDALILENSLIKQLKPKYNILLRDDKTYPYILIDKEADFPRLDIVRKIYDNKNYLYFGPYSSGIKDIIDSIYEFVPLVQKKSCIRGKEACLFYQIKRCCAPCVGKINKEEYAKILSNAIELLENPNKLINMLTNKMQKLAENLRFEEANILKLRIQKIRQITNVSVIDLAKLYNFDIFTILISKNKSILVKMFMRDGKITFSDYYFINHNDNDINLDYLYTQALINHYKHNPPLKLDSILLPVELESKNEIVDFFYSNFNKKIKILSPKSGDKKNLVELALKNAKNILDNNKDNKIAESLQSLLDLENIPNRIEIFDTSHHSGSNSVGGMVVFENDEFIKNSYRKYLLQGSDEYSQMQEMLTRRATDFASLPPPDLWLIDGGMGQINIALQILDSSGANVDVVAIAKEKIDHKAYRAKGGAKDIIRSANLEIRLAKDDERLLFLQKLRDEAHRYAITFHRKKKTDSLKNTSYTPSQVKKLLNYFGSFENINQANQELIKQVLRQKI